VTHVANVDGMTEGKLGPHESRGAGADALRWLDSSTRPLRHLPVAGLHLSARLAETVLRQVFRDPDGADRDDAAPLELYPRPDDETMTAPPDPHTSLRSMVHEMLERSMLQSPRQAKEANFKRLLLQLVPDEVRILAALADGTHHPVITVGFGPPGSAGEVVLRYASTVGRRAGVRCPENVPSYLAHLEALGLVAIGPEEEDLAEEYEVLEAQRQVRQADDAAAATGSAVDRLSFKSVRHARHAVCFSDLGRDLWDMAQPDVREYQVPGRAQD
jgi:hypothetical protein